MLGEEALRTAMVWKHGSSEAAAEAVKGSDQTLERGERTGVYCCYTCTLSFLRASTAVKPEGWEETLGKSINRIECAHARRQMARFSNLLHSASTFRGGQACCTNRAETCKKDR
ncbi:hypothetical protein MUP79_05595 [Candidatus Bathyarchaeota archaeon]|nr:hypothetical protein [Candidatus Bathyarchaeota archaeon]